MFRKLHHGGEVLASRLGLGLLLALALTTVGCGKSKAEAKAEHGEEKPKAAHAEHDEEGEEKEDEKKKRRKRKAEPPPAPPPVEARRYAVPFVWETSPDDPLARARGHLKEILNDNARYAKERGPRFFEAFAEGQKPRSTIVTCSDSRVQLNALDATPENDAFLIRNIGNLIENASGSVEYAVEQLRTSVLMIVGHTGCGAVKSALGKLDSLSESVRRELAPLRLSQQGQEEISDEVWAAAVVENVNNQVKVALDRFAPLVQEGKLTVVGGVFDFRNDLKQGAGKLVLVNVNGNTDKSAVSAFAKAVTSDGKIVMTTRADMGAGALRAEAIDDQHAAPNEHGVHAPSKDDAPAKAPAAHKDPAMRAPSLVEHTGH